MATQDNVAAEAVEHAESLAKRALHALSSGVHKLIENEEEKVTAWLTVEKTVGTGTVATDVPAATDAQVVPVPSLVEKVEEEVASVARKAEEAITVVLLKAHTHEGKKLPVGAEITTYLQQARWLVLMRIAEVKTTTTTKE